MELKWSRNNLEMEQEVNEIVTNQFLNLVSDNVEYHLMAFISHMGTSAMSGHYVCHIRKEGRWIIYNDNKVAVSVTPPKDLAYLYFYQREKQ